MKEPTGRKLISRFVEFDLSERIMHALDVIGIRLAELKEQSTARFDEHDYNGLETALWTLTSVVLNVKPPLVGYDLQEYGDPNDFSFFDDEKFDLPEETVALLVRIRQSAVALKEFYAAKGRLVITHQPIRHGDDLTIWELKAEFQRVTVMQFTYPLENIHDFLLLHLNVTETLLLQNIKDITDAAVVEKGIETCTTYAPRSKTISE